MDIITREVKRAIEARLYYVAVVLTLTLPDICAALESENGETTGPKYKAWCERWLGPSYPMLNGEDLWTLRCGVLHQGRLGHPKMSYSRVLFTVPNPQGNYFHNNLMNDALNLDLVTFCGDMLGAVSQWWDKNKDGKNVAANWPLLLQYRENGLAPYMTGTPLIA